MYAMLAGGPTVWSVQLQISKYVLMSGKSAGTGALLLLGLAGMSVRGSNIAHRFVRLWMCMQLGTVCFSLVLCVVCL